MELLQDLWMRHQFWTDNWRRLQAAHVSCGHCRAATTGTLLYVHLFLIVCDVECLLEASIARWLKA
jgi:hypothetical protein